MAADGLAARSVMYALLALHQMANYITRLAVPFIVPYLCNDFGFSEPQRAMLLNAFTPGYVMLQIPAGWFAARWGAKRLVTTHCLAIAGLLLLLPSLARRGAWAAAACIFAFGLAQAPFSVGSNIAKANWVPTGKERAWALMLISLGTTLSKNVSSFLTPWLSGRRGWRSVTTSYALGVAVFVGAWQLLASEHPKKPAVRPVLAPAAPAASPSRGSIAHFVKAKAERLPEAERRFFLEAAERLCWADGEWREHSGKRWADGRWQDQPAEPARKRGEDDQRTVQFDIERPDPGEEAGEKIGIWRLLLSAPTVANILNHMQHDMHEFQVLAAWAPTCERPLTVSVLSPRADCASCACRRLQPGARGSACAGRLLHAVADGLRDPRQVRHRRLGVCPHRPRLERTRHQAGCWRHRCRCGDPLWHGLRAGAESTAGDHRLCRVRGGPGV